MAFLLNLIWFVFGGLWLVASTNGAEPSEMCDTVEEGTGPHPSCAP